MKKENKTHLIISLSSLFFFLILWHLIAELSTTSVIPTPFEVFEALLKITIEGDNFGYTIIDHFNASFFRVIIGLYFALLIAIPLGLLIGLSKKVKWFFSPVIEILRPIPPFAWIPFALVFFGLGLMSQSFIIFIGAFFPILTNTINGVEQTSKIHVDVAKTLGASRGEIVAYVALPSALPSILVGIRIGLGVGWMCVIAAEMVGLNVPLGLGYLIQFSARFGNFGLTIAAMFITGVVGFGFYFCVKWIENYVLRWRESIVQENT